MTAGSEGFGNAALLRGCSGKRREETSKPKIYSASLHSLCSCPDRKQRGWGRLQVQEA